MNRLKNNQNSIAFIRECIKVVTQILEISCFPESEKNFRNSERTRNICCLFIIRFFYFLFFLNLYKIVVLYKGNS